jgi:ribosomal-protein-alanine N-acetyltransferase
MYVVAQTSLFTIREFTPADEVAFIELFTDYRITQYLPKRNAEQVQQLFKELRAEYTDGTGLNRWAVTDAETDELMGFGMLKQVTDKPDKAELGFVFHLKYHNKGLATQVSQTLVAYGFEQKDLNEIIAVTDYENIPSQRVLEKAGLKREGVVLRNDLELALFRITN